jgi:hypothetical protein
VQISLTVRVLRTLSLVARCKWKTCLLAGVDSSRSVIPVRVLPLGCPLESTRVAKSGPLLVRSKFILSRAIGIARLVQERRPHAKPGGPFTSELPMNFLRSSAGFYVPTSHGVSLTDPFSNIAPANQCASVKDQLSLTSFILFKFRVCFHVRKRFCRETSLKPAGRRRQFGKAQRRGAIAPSEKADSG